MAEIWGAAIVVAGGIAQGVAAEKKAKQDRKNAKEDNKEMTENEARLNAQQTGYESALDDYYKQKDRFETQRGLDQFRNFSTITNYAPGAEKYDGQLTAPVMPDYNSFAPAVTEQQQSSSGGKSKSVIEKLDPLGSKIFGGLF